MFIVEKFNEKYLADWKYDGAELEMTAGYDVKEVAKIYNLIGPAFMGFIDNKLIAIGGIYKIFEGIGQAWLFVNKIDRHKKDLFRSIKKHLEEIIKKENYKKVQMYCLKGSFKIDSLAKHLGFREITDLTLYEIGE